MSSGKTTLTYAVHSRKFDARIDWLNKDCTEKINNLKETLHEVFLDGVKFHDLYKKQLIAKHKCDLSTAKSKYLTHSINEKNMLWHIAHSLHIQVQALKEYIKTILPDMLTYVTNEKISEIIMQNCMLFDRTFAFDDLSDYALSQQQGGFTDYLQSLCSRKSSCLYPDLYHILSNEVDESVIATYYEYIILFIKENILPLVKNDFEKLMTDRSYIIRNFERVSNTASLDRLSTHN